jgi:hypothetical protein
MLESCSFPTSKQQCTARRGLQFIIIILHALALAGISLLVTSLTLDAIQGPPSAYLSVAPVVREVERGSVFRALVGYKKNRECAGNAIVTLTHAGTGEHRIVTSMPIGDRRPGEWTVERRYLVPEDAKPGLSYFSETLAYQCKEGPSIVRSPQMFVTITPRTTS